MAAISINNLILNILQKTDDVIEYANSETFRTKDKLGLQLFFHFRVTRGHMKFEKLNFIAILT